MMSCNWMIRNLIIKKSALGAAGFDILLLDNEKKVNDAFKKSDLTMPNMNNRGIA